MKIVKIALKAVANGLGGPRKIDRASFRFSVFCLFVLLFLLIFLLVLALGQAANGLGGPQIIDRASQVIP